MANLPADLTGLQKAPFKEIRPLLNALATEPDDRSATRLRGVLLDRVLYFLRRASRDEIEDEALALHTFLDTSPGSGLAKALPEAFGGFRAIGRLLTLASRRSDRAAVDSILRSHKGRPRPLLEILAEYGGPMARQELKERLDQQIETSESHLSHLLRELEEAELVERFRPESGRQVMVELGRIGREVVNTELLPAWVDWLADCLEELRITNDLSAPKSELEATLQKHQLSTPAARKLADALASLAIALQQKNAPPEALNTELYRQKIAEEIPRYDQAMQFQAGRPLVSLFSPPSLAKA